jgi:hypothetical protein
MRLMREVLDEIMKVNDRLAQDFIEASEGLYSITSIDFITHVGSENGLVKADAVVVTRVNTHPVQ